MSNQKHTHTAKPVEWDQKKGFGFLQHGKRRLFIHWRDFAVKHRRPVIGDEVRFVIGEDAQGRRCANEAEQVSEVGKLTYPIWGALLALLILPALALYRSGLNLLWSGTYVVVMSFITYRRYAHDKQLARSKEWRTPEAQLQILDILGGWPGGFLAQRSLQHKNRKRTYQFMFWLVVALYQFMAIDSLSGWPTLRAIMGGK